MIAVDENSLSDPDVILGAVIASGLMFKKRHHYSQGPKLR
jgi:hypothetical protein